MGGIALAREKSINQLGNEMIVKAHHSGKVLQSTETDQGLMDASTQQMVTIDRIVQDAVG